jgi:hypothetical protein
VVLSFVVFAVGVVVGVGGRELAYRRQERNAVDEQARETLKLRPKMDGVLVRRFRALRQLNRMEEAKELLVELRRRVPLYLLWNDITDFVHTRYAPEPTDRIHVTTWQIPNVFDLRPLPDNRMCAAAGKEGVWFLKPDGGSYLVPGTAESDGGVLEPQTALPTASGDVWVVSSGSTSSASVSEEENLQLWHDATGQLWCGVQQFDGKVFLHPNPKIRASFRKAWWLSGPRWWNPPEFWRREWVYLATHFRGPEDEGPLLRGSDRDTTGRLWVGLWNAGLMAFDGHRWLAIPLKDVPTTVRKVTTTSDGAVWAACEDRVVRVVATVAEQR